MKKRYALLSVSDKKGIVEVAQALHEAGIYLLSTGGTYQALKEAHIPVETVESVTHFPEMMDGRVKTLHPLIHGGLLANRNIEQHLQAMADHKIPSIEFVVVNLYPFEQTIQNKETTRAEAIEQIDIGGPTMLRSAAKNYEHITVVTDPRDYGTLVEQLQEKGETSTAFRAYLAQKVFAQTAYYDSLIADYLTVQAEDFKMYDWPFLTLGYTGMEVLRYGENSHQQAKVYRQSRPSKYSLLAAQQLHGKAMSYNNYNDADAAIKIACEFEEPVAVATKHTNPCGVAIGETIEQAFDRCYSADSISIFGGIVVVNRPVSLALAEKLHKIFLEIIIAPAYDVEAFQLLARKKNIRLLQMDFSDQAAIDQKEYRSIIGGLLEQTPDNSTELNSLGEAVALPKEWELMTDCAPTPEQLKAFQFGMKVCKHVKSNAIVINNAYMTLGIGAGQMNRVGAAEIALKQAAARDDFKPHEAVMASDAFFPMPDTVALAHTYEVPAIIQPGGSIRDQDSTDFCNAHQMTMVKTNIRHFRH
ncbi:bifunctional phosphoribosylaminoimidazolecarboxamide formyltransferase/IMP cyclohydrolase [Allofustis seminis]|uniref:bifunctional phosphoribosylaminoimidazolecarboxamide formyltransferase/IMP cyclohydrolase n=1 Tax=Allofustis seminis TaxID=166939 RepID=UPI00036B167F|nr:bifunctional phosphoribosylaminoimidazolecarboxamide formyltransferase/IMP cyclohydrolase [Allofustis seminis]